MNLLKGVEFREKGVERAEEFEGRRRVEVIDGGYGEAEEEVVCGLSCELSGVKGGHASQVGLVKEVRVEPVDAAFVSADVRC